jgi:hypothetical protein
MEPCSLSYFQIKVYRPPTGIDVLVTDNRF